MSLSRTDKLVRLAIIEGNIICAKLIRLLQPCLRVHGDAIACTDGRVIYVGERFWQLPLREQYFIVNHEFLHIILKHIERSEGKDMRIYNLAADVVINELLCQRGRIMPDGAATYSSLNVPRALKTTDDIYLYLLDNVKEDESGHGDLVVEPSAEIPEDVIKEMTSLVNQEIESKYHDQALKEQIVSVPQDFREKVDWFNDLMAEIGRLAVRTNIKTYNRPPRVKIAGCILKGGYVKQDIPKINIIIDVSGSMEREPLKIAAKIQAMQSYLKVFQPNYYWLNTAWGKIDDITNIKLGGGTDLSQIKYITGADMNVLITDCEDEKGVEAINNSSDRYYIVTNNPQTKIRKACNRNVFITKQF